MKEEKIPSITSMHREYQKRHLSDIVIKQEDNTLFIGTITMEDKENFIGIGTDQFDGQYVTGSIRDQIVILIVKKGDNKVLGYSGCFNVNGKPVLNRTTGDYQETAYIKRRDASDAEKEEIRSKFRLLSNGRLTPEKKKLLSRKGIVEITKK